MYDFSMDVSETMPPELEHFWRTDDGMTARERAEAYGIDLSLLEDNLQMSPTQRVDLNDQALELVRKLQNARKQNAGT